MMLDAQEKSKRITDEAEKVAKEKAEEIIGAHKEKEQDLKKSEELIYSHKQDLTRLKNDESLLNKRIEDERKRIEELNRKIQNEQTYLLRY